MSRYLEQDREQREQSLAIERARRARDDSRRIQQREEDARQKQEEAKLKKKAEEKAKPSAKKTAALSERNTIKAEYKKKIESITIPKLSLQKSRTHAQGKELYKNPEYLKAVNKLTAERDSALAKINIRESGVKVKKVVLSRTASKVMRGKARSSDYHVAYQVGVATANKQLRSGQITPTQYQDRLAKISRSYKDAQARFTKRNTPSAASLRAKGNTQVYSAIDTELKRLGGKGLGGNNNQGPTSVSATLAKDSPTIGKRVPVASGVTAKAQDFSKSFKIQTQPKTSSTPQRVSPQQNFAAIATPNTSFGITKQSSAPLKKDKTAKPIQGPTQNNFAGSLSHIYKDNINSSVKEKNVNRFFGQKIKDPQINSVLNLIKEHTDSAIAPLTNIGKTVDNIVRGSDHKILPTTVGLALDETISIPFKMYEQKKLVPKLDKPYLSKTVDFIHKNPVKAALQIPSEVVLWGISSAFAQPVSKVASKVASPLKNKIIQKTKPQEKLIDSIPEIKKSPLIVKKRIPNIGKDKLLDTIKTRQQSISGNPKLTPKKTVNADPSYKPSMRSNEISIDSGVIPKEKVVGKITLSKGFIPNKPARQYTPLDTKRPVKADPNYTPAKRANEIDTTDKIFPKEKIIGEIKLSKGFVPNKAPKPSKPFDTKKPVEEDPYYKPAKRTNEIDTTGVLPKVNIIGRIRLSKGFVPNKGKKVSMTSSYDGDKFKPIKVDLSGKPKNTSTKRRRFDDPKLGKDDRLVGGNGGTLQIVKAKNDIVKLKKKQVTPLKLVQKTESTAKTPKGTSNPTKLLKTKPVKKAKMQKIPRYVPYLATTALSASAQSGRGAEKISSGSKLKAPQKISSGLKPKQGTSQPSKQSSVLKTPQRMPTPQRPRLRTPARISPKLVQKQKLVSPTHKRKYAVGVLPAFTSDDRKRKKNGDRRADFLGNVRLGSIVGFERRQTITHGRKKIDNLIRKDPSLRNKRARL